MQAICRNTQSILEYAHAINQHVTFVFEDLALRVRDLQKPFALSLKCQSMNILYCDAEWGDSPHPIELLQPYARA
jgi:hypothetical protein